MDLVYALTSDPSLRLALQGRALGGQVNTTRLLTKAQARDIQITSCILAAISSIAALVTLVWFARMKRKFRHNLIFILIAADVSRSLWLFAFCLTSLVRSIPTSASPFCQISGFFFQSSTELADFAVLTIAIHTALQIFRPTIGRVGNRADEGGLYRFRIAIYVTACILPFLLASLAFVDGLPGYLSQGPYCSLPIRPFWFRLGLSWIPRYCILLTILGLYIAIYIHVAVQFRTIKWLRRIPGLPRSRSGGADAAAANASTHVDIHGVGGGDGVVEERRVSTLNLFSLRANRTSWSSLSLFHFPRRASRVSSSGNTLVGSSAGGVGHFEKGMHEHDFADHASQPDYHRQPSVASSFPRVDGTPDFITSALDPHHAANDDARFSKASSFEAQTLPPSTPRDTWAAAAGAGAGAASEKQHVLHHADSAKQMRQRHAQIQRQVRTLFIYPMIYFIMWLAPFVNHAINYSDYWAQHPIFWLVLLNFICISTMGWADCLVFCLRERPWRSIPDSDGSFLGSLVFWRRGGGRGRSPPRRPSEDSAASTSDTTHSAGTGEHKTGATPPRALGSIAEGDTEAESPLDEGRRRPSPHPHSSFHAPSTGHGLDVWDFAPVGGVSRGPTQTQTQTLNERNWFDRRLSMAVGRSVQPQPQVHVSQHP